MMGTWLPETCWATSRREIKNTKVTSSWFFLSTLNYDARSITHQICKIQVYAVLVWTILPCNVIPMAYHLQIEVRMYLGLFLEMSQLTDITKTMKYFRLQSISSSSPLYFINISGTKLESMSSLLGKLLLFKHKCQLSE
jgi:hypothetical protein